MKMTAKSVRELALPEGRSEIIYWDDTVSGLGLRIREGGSRTWIFQYKIGEKQRRLSLGSADADAISLDHARNGYKDRDRQVPGAVQLHAMVKLGIDPAAQKAEARVRASETFEAIARKYLAFQKQRMKPRSYVEVERHIRHCKSLHGMPLGSVSQARVAKLLGDIAEKSGPVAANRVRATISAFYTWARGEGLTQENPAAFTNKRDEKDRDRVLSNDELRLIWNALPAGDFGDIVRLLALTAQRREEIGGLKWSEIGGDLISLPAERVKNGRAHTIPLATPARAILGRQRFANRAHVFGRGQGGFSGWSRCKAALDKSIAAPLEPWTLHDLRRTAATRMADIGIQPHVIEAVLNHVSGHKAGVAGIYNRASYEPEKRAALDRWAENLLAIVEGRESNVIALRQA